jgi:hypothetical protein
MTDLEIFTLTPWHTAWRYQERPGGVFNQLWNICENPSRFAVIGRVSMWLFK